MSEASNAARFGTMLKRFGASFFWIAGFSAAIVYIANRHLVREPFLTFGLPVLIVIVGVVSGSVLRAAGYALRLQAERVESASPERAPLDA